MCSSGYLFVVEGYVPDLAPGKGDPWAELVVLFVDVQTQGSDSEPKVRLFFVLGIEERPTLVSNTLGAIQSQFTRQTALSCQSRDYANVFLIIWLHRKKDSKVRYSRGKYNIKKQ